MRLSAKDSFKDVLDFILLSRCCKLVASAEGWEVEFSEHIKNIYMETVMQKC